MRLREVKKLSHGCVVIITVILERFLDIVGIGGVKGAHDLAGPGLEFLPCHLVSCMIFHIPFNIPDPISSSINNG